MKDVYVITGGSGGMGSATAELLGKRGTVLLADISEEQGWAWGRFRHCKYD